MRVLSQSTGSFLIERPIIITWRLVNIVTISALSGARCPILLFRPGKVSPGDRVLEYNNEIVRNAEENGPVGFDY